MTKLPLPSRPPFGRKVNCGLISARGEAVCHPSGALAGGLESSDRMAIAAPAQNRAIIAVVRIERVILLIFVSSKRKGRAVSIQLCRAVFHIRRSRTLPHI